MASPDRAPSFAAPGAPLDAESGYSAAGEPAYLGRYRIVSEIGVGGMASVHLARMDGPGGFQKWVAVKRIHPHLAEDEAFTAMFLDEARVLARISHPNVAGVFELGLDDGIYWIAMEYLHGEALREIVRRGEETGRTLPTEIACRIIVDAAEGLHAAHELVGDNGEKLNLVHRDVTPHNLFVSYDGTTKVVDFGIAKFQTRASSTYTGQLKGKLAYMAPEQLNGLPLDRRTDVFALGIVLWELTTGHRLFRMENDLETFAKVYECAVPLPSSRVPGYPPELEAIVMKALSRSPGDRFDTARDMSRALQSFLHKRGGFVGSEDVAGYVRELMRDRALRREEHLRDAREATDAMMVRPTLGDDPRPSPRPAAGARPSLRPREEPKGGGEEVRVSPRPAAGMPPLAPMRPKASSASTISRVTESDRGVFIKTPAPPPVGTVLALDVRLDEATVLKRTARVIATRDAASVGVDAAGMRIEFIDDDDAAAQEATPWKAPSAVEAPSTEPRVAAAPELGASSTQVDARLLDAPVGTARDTPLMVPVASSTPRPAAPPASSPAADASGAVPVVARENVATPGSGRRGNGIVIACGVAAVLLAGSGVAVWRFVRAPVPSANAAATAATAAPAKAATSIAAPRREDPVEPGPSPTASGAAVIELPSEPTPAGASAKPAGRPARSHKPRPPASAAPSSEPSAEAVSTASASPAPAQTLSPTPTEAP